MELPAGVTDAYYDPEKVTALENKHPSDSWKLTIFFSYFSVVGPSFLSLYPSSGVGGGTIVPATRCGHPIVYRCACHISSISALLSRLLFRAPRGQIRCAMSRRLCRILVGGLLVFLRLFLPNSRSETRQPISSVPLRDSRVLRESTPLFPRARSL